MTKVICTLENAESPINGVEFEQHSNGEHLISKVVVAEPALSVFLSIPGYELDEAEQAKPKTESAKERKERIKAEQAEAKAAEPVEPTAVEPEPEVEADSGDDEVF